MTTQKQPDDIIKRIMEPELYKDEQARKPKGQTPKKAP